MAFGFLVERFDLFLEIAGQTLARRALSPTGQIVGNTAGLILIGLGAGLMGLAIVRFRRTSIEIDRPETVPGPGDRADVVLASLLTVLGCALFVYLSYTVVSRL
jgi:putative membrane protein